MNLNNIDINCGQAQQFITYSPQRLENKVVLKVDEQGLRFIPLAETTFFEVVQARFGYGPLSLTNIVDFISKNAEAVNKAHDYSDVSKEDFLTKIRDCSNSHNSKSLNRKVNSFALEIILKDFVHFSLASNDIQNAILEIIEPPAPKDMAQVARAKILKNGHKSLNIGLVNKCFNALVSKKLGDIRTVWLLMNKYSARNKAYEECIQNKFHVSAHPQLLDALLTGPEYGGFYHTFDKFNASVEDDIRKIVSLTPQSINCVMGLRCRLEVPALYIASMNRDIPLSIVDFLLLNGANPDQKIYVCESISTYPTILADLKETDLDPIRLKALKELFQKYRNKNSLQAEGLALSLNIKVKQSESTSG